MEMAVDKTRAEISSVKILFHQAFISPDTCNPAVRNRYISLKDLTCKYIYNICILQNKLCLFPVPGHLGAPPVIFPFHNAAPFVYILIMLPDIAFRICLCAVE